MKANKANEPRRDSRRRRPSTRRPSHPVFLRPSRMAANCRQTRGRGNHRVTKLCRDPADSLRLDDETSCSRVDTLKRVGYGVGNSVARVIPNESLFICLGNLIENYTPRHRHHRRLLIDHSSQ